MKPKILIGSSVEGLSVARAIQANLDYDAEVTIWNQGIFQLSISALDSLMEALDRFEFGIFVFQPDDSTIQRGTLVPTVRDNVLFELGLFLGRLGSNRVFFVVPRSASALHLPTDLLGIIPGNYNDKRSDNNLLASLEPFCDIVRQRIRDYAINNLQDFKDDPVHIREMVVRKPKYWEFLLACEILDYKMQPINRTYHELKSNRIVPRVRTYSGKELLDWWSNYTSTLQRIIPQYQQFVEELKNAYGPIGTPGNPTEIKYAAERIAALCGALMNIELELYSMETPEELSGVRTTLLGITKPAFIDEVNRLSKDTRDFILNIDNQGPKVLNVVLHLKLPNLENLPGLFSKYIQKFGPLS